MPSNTTTEWRVGQTVRLNDAGRDIWYSGWIARASDNGNLVVGVNGAGRRDWPDEDDDVFVQEREGVGLPGRGGQYIGAEYLEAVGEAPAPSENFPVGAEVRVDWGRAGMVSPHGDDATYVIGPHPDYAEDDRGELWDYPDEDGEVHVVWIDDYEAGRYCCGEWVKAEYVTVLGQESPSSASEASTSASEAAPYTYPTGFTVGDRVRVTGDYADRFDGPTEVVEPRNKTEDRREVLVRYDERGHRHATADGSRAWWVMARDLEKVEDTWAYPSGLRPGDRVRITGGREADYFNGVTTTVVEPVDRDRASVVRDGEVLVERPGGHTRASVGGQESWWVPGRDIVKVEDEQPAAQAGGILPRRRYNGSDFLPDTLLSFSGFLWHIDADGNFAEVITERRPVIDWDTEDHMPANADGWFGTVLSGESMGFRDVIVSIERGGLRDTEEAPVVSQVGRQLPQRPGYSPNDFLPGTVLRWVRWDWTIAEDGTVQESSNSGLLYSHRIGQQHFESVLRGAWQAEPYDITIREGGLKNPPAEWGAQPQQAATPVFESGAQVRVSQTPSIRPGRGGDGSVAGIFNGATGSLVRKDADDCWLVQLPDGEGSNWIHESHLTLVAAEALPTPELGVGVRVQISDEPYCGDPGDYVDGRWHGATGVIDRAATVPGRWVVRLDGGEAHETQFINEACLTALPPEGATPSEPERRWDNLRAGDAISHLVIASDDLRKDDFREGDIFLVNGVGWDVGSVEIQIHGDSPHGYRHRRVGSPVWVNGGTASMTGDHPLGNAIRRNGVTMVSREWSPTMVHHTAQAATPNAGDEDRVYIGDDGRLVLQAGDRVVMQDNALSPTGRDRSNATLTVGSPEVGDEYTGSDGDARTMFMDSVGNLQYRHQVVEINGRRVAELRQLPVPDRETFTKAEVEALLRKAEDRDHAAFAAWVEDMGRDVIPYARERGFCGDAERFLNRWNVPHRGRDKDYYKGEVTITIPVSGTRDRGYVGEGFDERAVRRMLQEQINAERARALAGDGINVGEVRVDFNISEDKG